MRAFGAQKIRHRNEETVRHEVTEGTSGAPFPPRSPSTQEPRSSAAPPVGSPASSRIRCGHPSPRRQHDCRPCTTARERTDSRALLSADDATDHCAAGSRCADGKASFVLVAGATATQDRVRML